MFYVPSHKWLLFLGILAACTCGGGTSECRKNPQLSLLTSIHDDPACEVISHRGVMTYEAAQLIVDSYNQRTDDLKIDLSIMDTCDTIDGTIKAAIKALMAADLNCLHAPHYLGIIGPESSSNIDVVQKITSILNIPHIVHHSGLPPSAYLHFLEKESIFYMVAGILEVIDALRWKSFTLVAPRHDSGQEDSLLIAKKFIMAAVTRGLCVMIHDQEADSITSRVVHIGRPEAEFFLQTNATVLLVSLGYLEDYLENIDSHSPILLLQDTRNDFPNLSERVENSKWWSEEQKQNKHNAIELSEVRWLENAVGIFTKSLENLCAKHECSTDAMPSEWNTIIANTLAMHNDAKPSASVPSRKLQLLLKHSDANVEKIGEISVKDTVSTLHWINQDLENDEITSETVPESFRELISTIKDPLSDCSTISKDPKGKHDVTRVLFADVNDEEWWTMIAIVGGIGVVMFTVGIFAVYVVIVNIREPKTSKNKGGRRIQRDFSLRRVSSIQDSQTELETPQRPPRNHHCERRDSNRSNISDKSV